MLIGTLLKEYGMRTPLIKNVVGTETRGVSQREGSVLATARYLIDARVYSLDQGYEVEDLISPLIPTNDAHLVIGLEPLETLRNLRFISEQTVVVLNTHRHYPRGVIVGSERKEEYPSNAKILNLMDQFARRVVSADFHELSKTKFRNSIFSNIIALGVAVKEFREIFLKDDMVTLLKETFGETSKNLDAFELGHGLIKSTGF